MADFNLTYSKEYESGELLQKIVMCPAIIGFVINIFIIVIVSANPGMRSTTDLFILNLSFNDCIVLVCATTEYNMPRWPFGEKLHISVQYCNALVTHISAYTLVLMSLDRSMAVIYPMTSISIRTEKNALLAIAVVWLMQSSCVFLENQITHHQTYGITTFLSSYVIPLALISGLYMWMLIRMWKNAPGGRMSAESRRRKKRVTKMVVTAVVVFAVCWCPIQIILLLKALDVYSFNNFTVMAQMVAQLLACMNSVLNPFLYAFSSENYRVAFKKLMYCRRGGRERNYAVRLTNRPQPTRTGRGDPCLNVAVVRGRPAGDELETQV